MHPYIFTITQAAHTGILLNENANNPHTIANHLYSNESLYLNTVLNYGLCSVGICRALS